ncbi:MAG: hypothetical protein ACJ777_02720 [Chloroflexota bacterium]
MHAGGPPSAAGSTSGLDLAGVATAVTGVAVRDAVVVERRQADYDPFLPGRRVERVAGSATSLRGRAVAWRAIVKTTTGPGLRDARRELGAYRLGIASASATTGLAAPRLLGWRDEHDTVEVWLEVLRDLDGGAWGLARFSAAARAIARWDAHWLHVPVPDGFDSQDAWAERHGQPERVTEALDELEAHRRQDGADALMSDLADPGFARMEAMIASTPRRIAELATFPRALLHHDLVRSNLFAVSPRRIAAIDWEHVGRGPLGVDLAPLVGGSVRRGEASADALPDLERMVLAGYTRALRAAGVPPPLVAGVPDAYRLALGLRWHVVLGTISAALDPTTTRIRGSRPTEPRSESLAHLVVLARYLLAGGDGRRA